MSDHGRTLKFVSRCLIPIVFCLVVGALFFQSDVFRPHMAAFQFVVSGIVAALFYNLMVYLDVRRAFAGLLVLFLLQLFMDRAFGAAIILRDFFYIGGIGAAVFLFSRYFARGGKRGFLQSGAMFAGVYSLIMIVATECDLLLLKTFDVRISPYVAESARTSYFLAPGVLLAVLVGFAAGAGFEASERFFSPLVRIEAGTTAGN